MEPNGVDLVASVVAVVIHPGCHPGSEEGCWVRHRAEARTHIVAELERLLIGLGVAALEVVGPTRSSSKVETGVEK